MSSEIYYKRCKEIPHQHHIPPPPPTPPPPPAPPPPPHSKKKKKIKFDFKKIKKNTICSLNEVECFLNNFNRFFNYVKLYKILK